MNKDLLPKQVKYAESLKSRLSETTIPEKHKNRPVQYREFLERELKKVNRKIEDLKLSGADAKK
jgi:hypothetical protein